MPATATPCSAALADQAGIDVNDVSVEDIGPTFGAEVRRQAIKG